MPERVVLDYGEIIAILKICKLYDIKVNIEFDNNKTTGRIGDISDYTLTIKTDSEIPSSVKSLEISFELNKEPYHFKGDVVKISSKEVMVLIPSQLEVWRPRKYERSPCYGKVFCNMNIIRDLSPNLRERISTMPPKFEELFKEISKDTPNVSLVIKMVQEELSRSFDISEIFLHKQGETLPLPVVIITKYRKPLLLEDTQEEASYFKRYIGNEVVCFGKFMVDLNWSTGKIKDEVKKFIAFFNSNNIRSIAYAPIFLFENVVGHIRVASLLSKVSKVLTLKDVFYVQSFADIVSEALAKYKLFSLTSSSEFPLVVCDISVGGAKIEVEQYLAKFLEQGTKVKLIFKFNDGKVVIVKGKILRIDSGEEKLFVAVEFENLDRMDEIIINDFVSKNKGG